MAAKRGFKRIHSQIFVWSGNDPLYLRYDGKTFVIPPIDESAKPGLPGSIYPLESARNGSGELIPGTVVISDIFDETESGGYVKRFDVATMCEFLDRECGHLFNIGFSIVQDPNDVKFAQADGRPKWEAAQDRSAEGIIQAELERIRRHEEKGQVAPPASNAARVKWAVSHLNARRSVRSVDVMTADELRGALEGHFAAPAAAPAAPVAKPLPKANRTDTLAPLPPPPPDGVDVMSVYQEAQELGVALSKRELEGLLGRDAESVSFVIEKIKTKREVMQEQQATA